MKKVVALLTVLLVTGAVSGYAGSVRKIVMQTVDHYFHGEDIDGARFEQVTEKVYTFHWNWYRNIVIRTSAGLVVIDPMNTKMVKALKAELDAAFPGEKVHTLVYSHYHLDHTSGGAELEPLNVLAHEKNPVYWKAVEHSAVLEPTDYVAGDKVLTIGGVEIRMLYLGLSHTDTLYAFHIPSERLVFTADLGLVKTVSPVGVPDRYAPGYLAAIDRVIAIDFDTFIPSHFGFGRNQDLIDWRNILEEGRRLAREAIQSYGTPVLGTNQMGQYFDAVYYPMREKYGGWHGFNEIFVLNLVRDVTGESLGY